MLKRDRRRPESADIRRRLDAYLQRASESLETTRLVRLTGDASDRRYFRMLLPGDASKILALHAEPFDFARLPFANVAELLGRIPLPIPRILEHHDDLGLLVLDDLGDVTLQAHLGAVDASERESLYHEAIGLIVRLQQRGRELASPAYAPYGVTFDVEKLLWELEFFVKHFIEGYRAVTIPPDRRAILSEDCLRLATELAAEPQVVCHRDYHSRNLMWHDSRLYVIDFQDARLGPDTYDLASLLRDSYVDLDERTTVDLMEYFLELTGGPEEEFGEFRRRFDLMALQRNLKALGTFGYQTRVRGNPVYIQYIPRTLRYVRDTLARRPRYARLRDTLASLLPELQ